MQYRNILLPEAQLIKVLHFTAACFAAHRPSLSSFSIRGFRLLLLEQSGDILGELRELGKLRIYEVFVCMQSQS